MTRTELVAHLRTLNACDAALEWIDQTLGSPEDLWAACQRGDWLLWLLDAVAYDAGTMRHIACDIAEEALPIYERAYPDDPRPRNLIAVARRYAAGEATPAELLAARLEAEEAARAAAMSRLADMVRARVSWTDVERALERFEAAKMK